MPPPILLYDGICGLCNRGVQFILERDPNAIFRFASLQSPLAARILARHGVIAADLDTVYIVINADQAGERLLPRSDAVIFILSQLGGVWHPAAFFLRLIPSPLRDWGYRLVARTRYRIFGRYGTCPLPSAATRARFLDV